MNAKILLIAFSVAAFSSCSTAYKSGQTPDDVYYSPVRPIEDNKDEEKDRYESKPDENTAANNRIRMTIRDRRWREFDNDYDYSYNNSPYRYCNSSYNSYGYYYNPYYYSKPVYYPNYTPKGPINTTPRMVNLNSYKNYTTAVNNTKTGTTTTTTSNRQYNNSNNSGSRVGNILRQVITPSNNTNNSNSNSSNNNNTRTYTPATNNSSSTPSSSGSSSGGSSSGGSVSRPGRG